MIEETEPVQIHVGLALQKVFLQRVLETVGSFGGVLKQLVGLPCA